ncbi:hypothetical protein B0H12DRAFT_1157636 [Mycena haematopus]|nr:hypothetical protein B0H12DRAFT_1157636 [Mycena haematopus]
MPRARLGLKAPAWAWLGWARAQDFASPSPSPQTGLGRAGLGLGPGLLSYFVLCALRISFKSNNTVHILFGLGCWSKLEIFCKLPRIGKGAGNTSRLLANRARPTRLGNHTHLPLISYLSYPSYPLLITLIYRHGLYPLLREDFVSSFT